MLNRLVNLALAVGCTILGVGLLRSGAMQAKGPNAAAVLPAASRPTFADDQALLDRHIDRVLLDNVTLDQAIVALSDLTNVNIRADWRALADAGLSRSERIRVHARDATLGQVLTLVLDNVVTLEKLVFFSEKRLITITSASSTASDYTHTEYFNIRPLIAELARVAAELPGENGLTPRVVSIQEEIIEQIFKLITDSVDTNSWRSAGGQAGSYRELSGILVITQSRENLALIQKLLTDLHQSLHRVDFPPIAHRLPASPPADQAVVEERFPSTQPVMAFFNIAPLIEELRGATATAAPRGAGQDGRLRDQIIKDVISIIATAVTEETWQARVWPEDHVQILGDIIAVKESPANIRAIRIALENLHKVAAGRLPSAAPAR